MITVVLLLVSVCACAVWLVRVRVRQSCAHALPPAYPGELPIVGHLHHLWTDTSKLWKLCQSIIIHSLKQGGVTYCKFGKIYYIITDPEDGLTVANSCLKKCYMYDFAQNWLGHGLLTSSGSIWQHRRKMVSPAFTVPVIHNCLNVFNDQARELVKSLGPHLGTPEYNILPHLKKLTLQTACLTVFGIKDIKSSSFYAKYLDAIDKMKYMLTNRFQTFWQHSDLLYSIWHKKIEDKVVKTVNELSDEVIRKCKETLMNGAASDKLSYKPMLHYILESNYENALTDVEIREDLNTAIVAAFETTGSALAHTLILLGSYPEVQEKLYEEAIQVLGTEGDVEKYDLQKLVYTEAVIKESVRLFPSAPLVGRCIDKDVKLKNYTLRAGSDCLLMIYGMHRHPSWGPDAEHFKPERWLDPATLPEDPNAFAAFSFGKRSCIGKTYALTLMKVAMVHLVRKYRWTADCTKLQFKIDVTLECVSGHEVTLHRRS